MSGYTDIYDAANSSGTALRKQTAVAIRKAATDVLNESVDTVNHAARVEWATAVNLNTAEWVNKMIWSVLENPTVASSPETQLDDTIQFVVNSLVNTYSASFVVEVE